MNDIFEQHDIRVSHKGHANKYWVEYWYDYNSLTDAMPFLHCERREPVKGERIVWQDRGDVVLYDYDKAVKAYKAGGCGKKQAVQNAEADIARAYGFYRDDWCYIGIVVMPYCEHCDQPDRKKAESLWGIESDSGEEYFEEVIAELVAAVTRPRPNVIQTTGDLITPVGDSHANH